MAAGSAATAGPGSLMARAVRDCERQRPPVAVDIARRDGSHNYVRQNQSMTPFVIARRRSRRGNLAVAGRSDGSRRKQQDCFVACRLLAMTYFNVPLRGGAEPAWNRLCCGPARPRGGSRASVRMRCQPPLAVIARPRRGRGNLAVLARGHENTCSQNRCLCRRPKLHGRTAFGGPARGTLDPLRNRNRPSAVSLRRERSGEEQA
jgi:hypothetical protein